MFITKQINTNFFFKKKYSLFTNRGIQNYNKLIFKKPLLKKSYMFQIFSLLTFFYFLAYTSVKSFIKFFFCLLLLNLLLFLLLIIFNYKLYIITFPGLFFILLLLSIFESIFFSSIFFSSINFMFHINALSLFCQIK